MFSLMGPASSLLRLGAVSLDVLTAARLAPSDVAARQAGRLARLLEAAAAGSPWYRRVLHGKVAAATTLAELPPVTKAELMQHFAEWVTDPRLDLATLREFTADSARIGESVLGRYCVWESSGSGGSPGLFVQDEHSLAVYEALEALRHSAPRPLQRLLDPLFVGERIAFVGAIGGHFASQVSVQRMRGRYPWLASVLRSFSILQPAPALVEQLNAFAPTIIATYPSAAALLADQARCGALRARPRECWTGGETLSAAVRADVEQSLGCTLRNSYGASEFLSIGWECARGRMHVNSDWVILEPVDRQYRPVPPGEAGHTTLLTNLANHVQPLIRYDLGDEVTFHAARCECGSPLPAIDVLGRHDDSLQLRSDAGRVITLLPLALSTVLEDRAGLYDFQLCQRNARTLELRVGAGSVDPSAALARGRLALQAHLQEHGLGKVRIVDAPGVAPLQGKSGKVKRVVALALPRQRARRAE
jgi:phenylacetate-CoA ligase